VLAATNRDLEAQITAGRFREDLFYRLNVMEIYIPPLRERPEDILPLATHFIGQFSRLQPRFSASVSACLTRYRWPGNVRELRNAMERAALLSRGEIVLPGASPRADSRGDGRCGAGRPVEVQRLEEIEREAILKALRKNIFNRTETAKELAISRRALTYNCNTCASKASRRPRPTTPPPDRPAIARWIYRLPRDGRNLVLAPDSQPPSPP